MGRFRLPRPGENWLPVDTQAPAARMTRVRSLISGVAIRSRELSQLVVRCWSPSSPCGVCSNAITPPAFGTSCAATGAVPGTGTFRSARRSRPESRLSASQRFSKLKRPPAIPAGHVSGGCAGAVGGPSGTRSPPRAGGPSPDGRPPPPATPLPSAAFPAQPRAQSRWSLEECSSASRWPSRSSVQNRARFCPESSLPGRSGAPSCPNEPRPPDIPLPSCSQPGPAPIWLLVSTPAPIGAPPARNRGRSTSYVTSSQPESGADDTGAMSAGRWGHLSRLTESPTRVEVTETTRCDGTPRHRRRQTCAERWRTRRSCRSGDAPFECAPAAATRYRSATRSAVDCTGAAADPSPFRTVTRTPRRARGANCCQLRRQPAVQFASRAP